MTCCTNLHVLSAGRQQAAGFGTPPLEERHCSETYQLSVPSSSMDQSNMIMANGCKLQPVVEFFLRFSGDARDGCETADERKHGSF